MTVDEMSEAAEDEERVKLRGSEPTLPCEAAVAVPVVFFSTVMKQNVV